MNPTAQPWKTAVLAAFALLCLLMFAYLYSGTGAQVPFFHASDLEAQFFTPDAGNLAPACDVRIAGVVVGQVESVQNDGARGALIKLRIDKSAAQLHQGAQVRVGERSLVGEGVVNVIDGTGKPLASGATLPAKSVQPSVQLADVLRSLDAPTRKALGGTVRSLGNGVAGRTTQVDRLFTSLGLLGNGGRDVTRALKGQSTSLTHLVRTSSEVLRALDVSEGQLGQLFHSTDAITTATSHQTRAIRRTMVALPGALHDGRRAFNAVGVLSGDLRPVARSLRSAAPYLTTALQQLPPTARDLRGLLPSLNSALGKAPATLREVPTFARDVSNIVAPGRDILAQANPMLRYVEPYGHELAAFFTNFRGVMNFTDEAGINYLRLAPIMGNTAVVSGVPVYTGELTQTENPYPAPGGLRHVTGHERPFKRLYPDRR